MINFQIKKYTVHGMMWNIQTGVELIITTDNVNTKLLLKMRK